VPITGIAACCARRERPRRRQADKRRGVKLGGPRLAAARKASIALLSPEIPKPIRGQLDVTHRVLNILVPQPSL